MDARWRRSEKEEEKRVKKKNSDDVEMIDEDDADSSLNQMTTKVRKPKRMKNISLDIDEAAVVDEDCEEKLEVSCQIRGV